MADHWDRLGQEQGHGNRQSNSHGQRTPPDMAREDLDDQRLTVPR